MAYSKHFWQDEIVQYPSRYKLKDKTSGAVIAEYDLERVVGSVTVQDQVNALKLNNLEDGLESIDDSLDATKTIVDIARTAKLDTGTANTYAVDTQGTFDLTLDGNTITFIPNNTNTGASTINFDGQGAVTIQKANDAGTLVALEANDLVKNRPVTIVRRVGTNVFILRPSGGATGILIKNSAVIQKKSTTPSNLKLTVSGTGWVECWGTSSTQEFAIVIDGVVYEASYGSAYIGPVKFNTDFKFYGTGAGGSFVVGYSLDSNSTSYKGLNYTINKYSTVSEADTTQLRVDLTGKGWLRNLRALSTQTKIVIDGTTVTNTHQRSSDVSSVTCNIRFEQSLKIYSNAGASQNDYLWSYTLD